MSYEAFFRQQLSVLRREGNYRVFVDSNARRGGSPGQCITTIADATT